MRNRLVPIILLVVGILVLAIAGIVFLIGGVGEDTEPTPEGPVAIVTNDSGTPVTQPIATLPPTVEVVVSLQTVPRGYQMRREDLDTEIRLTSEIGDNVYTVITDVVGLYARTTIYQGETLTAPDVVKDPRLIGQENYGPSSLIPTNWLAIAVPMDRLSSAAYAMSSGDTVDVLLTFQLTEIDEEFQALIEKSLVFYLPKESGGEPEQIIIDPYGRLETLPTGDIENIIGSEYPRPFPVSVLLQSAKVIQVGAWKPIVIVGPTPTPLPDQPTPTPGGAVVATPTPTRPDVVVLALPPQQQVFLKYAIESGANIDFAVRRPDDGQIQDVQNVDLGFILNQFNIEIPANFNYATISEKSNTASDETTTTGNEGQ